MASGVNLNQVNHFVLRKQHLTYADPRIKLFLFKSVPENALKSIYAEAGKIGVFLAGREVRIAECSDMIPLTQRTAGGFMSPLKGD